MIIVQFNSNVLVHACLFAGTQLCWYETVDLKLFFFLTPLCACVGGVYRFREGLRTLGVYEQIQMAPEAFYQLFCFPPEKLCADSMVALFTPQFSEREDYRAKETVTTQQWQQFLQECEGGYPFWQPQYLINIAF